MASVEEYMLNFKLSFASANQSLDAFNRRVNTLQKNLDKAGKIELKANFDPRQIKNAFDAAISRSKLKADIDAALTITSSNINLKPLQDEISRKLKRVSSSGTSLKETIGINVHLADTQSVAKEINDLIGKKELAIAPVLHVQSRSKFLTDLNNFLESGDRKIKIDVEDVNGNLREVARTAASLKSRDINSTLIIKTEAAQNSVDAFHKKNRTMKTDIEFTEKEKGSILKNLKDVIESPKKLRFNTDNFSADINKQIKDSLSKSSEVGIKEGIRRGLKDSRNDPISLAVKEIEVKQIKDKPGVIAAFAKQISEALQLRLEKATLDVMKMNIRAEVVQANITQQGGSSANQGASTGTQTGNSPPFTSESPEYISPEGYEDHYKKALAQARSKIGDKSLGGRSAEDFALESIDSLVKAIEKRNNDSSKDPIKNEISYVKTSVSNRINRALKNSSKEVSIDQPTGVDDDSPTLSDSLQDTKTLDPLQALVKKRKENQDNFVKDLEFNEDIVKKVKSQYDQNEKAFISSLLEIHNKNPEFETFSGKQKADIPAIFSKFNENLKKSGRRTYEEDDYDLFEIIYDTSVGKFLEDYQGASKTSNISGITRKPFNVENFGHIRFGGLDKFIELAESSAGVPSFRSVGEGESSGLGQNQPAGFDSSQNQILIRSSYLDQGNELKQQTILAHELVHSFFEGYGKELDDFIKNINVDQQVNELRRIIARAGKDKLDINQIENFVKLTNEALGGAGLIKSIGQPLSSFDPRISSSGSPTTGTLSEIINSQNVSTESLQLMHFASAGRAPKIKELEGLKDSISVGPDASVSEFTNIQKQALLNAGQEFTTSLIGVISAGRRRQDEINMAEATGDKAGLRAALKRNSLSEDESSFGYIGPELFEEIMKRFGNIQVNTSKGIQTLTGDLERLAKSAANGDVDPLFERLVKMIDFLGKAADQVPDISRAGFQNKLQNITEENQSSILGTSFREQTLRTQLIGDQANLRTNLRETNRLPEYRNRARELEARIETDLPDHQMKQAKRALESVLRKIEAAENILPSNQIENLKNKTASHDDMSERFDRTKWLTLFPEQNNVEAYRGDINAAESSKKDLGTYIESLKQARSLGEDFTSKLSDGVQEDIKNLDSLTNEFNELTKMIRNARNELKDFANVEIERRKASGQKIDSSLLAASHGLTETRSGLIEGLYSRRFGTHFEPSIQAMSELDVFTQQRHIEKLQQMGLKTSSFDLPKPETRSQGLDPGSYEAQIIAQREKLQKATEDSRKFGDVRKTVIQIEEEGTKNLRIQQAVWIRNGEIIAVNAEKYRGMAGAMIALDGSVKRTLSRVMQWGAASYAVYSVFNAFKRTVDIVVEFDMQMKIMQSLTTASESRLKELGKTALQVGQEYGRGFGDVLKTMNEFLRQGIAVQDVANATRSAMLLANVAMIEAAEANKLLLSVMKQFNLDGTQYEEVTDKITALGDAYAVSAEDVARGIARSGSTAKTLGLDLNQLSSIIATVGEVTQKTGNEVGTSFRTILARGVSPTAIKLFDSLGIAVVGSGGKLKDFGDIIDEIGGSWENFSQIQKVSIAEALGGRVRLNDVFSLFENYERYLQGVDIATNSVGSASRKNAILMQSMAKEIEAAKAATQGLLVALGEGGLNATISTLTFGITGLTSAIQVMNNATGGLAASVAGVGAVGAGAISGLAVLGQNLGYTGFGQGMFRKREPETIFTGKTNEEVLKMFTSREGRKGAIQNLSSTVSTEGAGATFGAATASRGGIVARGAASIGIVGTMLAEFAIFAAAFAALAAVVLGVVKLFEHLNKSTKNLVDAQSILIEESRDAERALKESLGSSSSSLRITDGRIRLRDQEQPVSSEEVNRIGLNLAQDERFSEYLRIGTSSTGAFQVGLKGQDINNTVEGLNRILSNFEKNVLAQSLGSISAFSTSQDEGMFRGPLRRWRNAPVQVTSGLGSNFESIEFDSEEARKMLQALNSRDPKEAAKAYKELSDVLIELTQNTSQLLSLQGFDLSEIYGDPAKLADFQQRARIMGEMMAPFVDNIKNPKLLAKGQEQEIQRFGTMNLANMSLQSQSINVFESSDFLDREDPWEKIATNEMKFDQNTKELVDFSRSVSYAFGKIKDENDLLVESENKRQDVLDAVGKFTIGFIKNTEDGTITTRIFSKDINNNIKILDEYGETLRNLTEEELSNVAFLTDKTSKAFDGQASSIERLTRSIKDLQDHLNRVANQSEVIQKLFDQTRYASTTRQGMLGYTAPGDFAQMGQANIQNLRDIASIRDGGILRGRNSGVVANEANELQNFLFLNNVSGGRIGSAISGSGVQLPTRTIDLLDESIKTLYNRAREGNVTQAEANREITSAANELASLKRLQPLLVDQAYSVNQRTGQATENFLESQINTIQSHLLLAVEQVGRRQNLSKEDVSIISGINLAQSLASGGYISDDRTSDLYQLLNTSPLDDVFKNAERTGRTLATDAPDIDTFAEKLSEYTQETRGSLQKTFDQFNQTYQQILQKFTNQYGDVSAYMSQYGSLEAQIDPLRSEEAGSYLQNVNDILAEFINNLIRINEFDPSVIGTMVDGLNMMFKVNQDIIAAANSLMQTGVQGRSGTGSLMQQGSASRVAAEQQRMAIFEEMEKQRNNPEALAILQERAERNAERLHLDISGETDYGTQAVSIYDRFRAGRITEEDEASLQQNPFLKEIFAALKQDEIDAEQLGISEQHKKTTPRDRASLINAILSGDPLQYEKGTPFSEQMQTNQNLVSVTRAARVAELERPEKEFLGRLNTEEARDMTIRANLVNLISENEAIEAAIKMGKIQYENTDDELGFLMKALFSNTPLDLKVKILPEKMDDWYEQTKEKVSNFFSDMFPSAPVEKDSNFTEKQRELLKSNSLSLLETNKQINQIDPQEDLGLGFRFFGQNQEQGQKLVETMISLRNNKESLDNIIANLPKDYDPFKRGALENQSQKMGSYLYDGEENYVFNTSKLFGDPLTNVLSGEITQEQTIFKDLDQDKLIALLKINEEIQSLLSNNDIFQLASEKIEINEQAQDVAQKVGDVIVSAVTRVAEASQVAVDNASTFDPPVIKTSTEDIKKEVEVVKEVQKSSMLDNLWNNAIDALDFSSSNSGINKLIDNTMNSKIGRGIDKLSTTVPGKYISNEIINKEEVILNKIDNFMDEKDSVQRNLSNANVSAGTVSIYTTSLVNTVSNEVIPKHHSGVLAGDEHLAILQEGEAVIPRGLVGMIPKPLLDSLPKNGKLNGMISSVDSIANKTMKSLPKFHNGLGLTSAATNTLNIEIETLTREINNLSRAIREINYTQTKDNDGANEGMIEMFKLMYDGFIELKNSQSNIADSIGRTISESLLKVNDITTNEINSDNNNKTNRLDLFINGETKVSVDFNADEIGNTTNDVAQRVIQYIQQNPSFLARMIENQPIIGME